MQAHIINRGGENMGLINGFLTYLLLMFIIVCVGGVGIFFGLKLRKKKDAQKAMKDDANE